MHTPFDASADSTLEDLIEIATAAAAAIRDVYAQDFAVESKSDQTPVTAADLAAHEIIADGLATHFPRTHCVSEEGVIAPYAERAGWESFWLVDPLDGTREYVSRNGEFSVNIAWIVQGYPILGVVLEVVTDTVYCAQPNKGASRGRIGESRSPIQVANQKRSTPRIVGSRSHQNPVLSEWLASRPEHAFLPCGSSLKFCRLAEGKADIYPRFSPTCAWDTAAGQAVAEAAGALVQTWSGERLHYRPRPTLINPDFFAADPVWRAWTMEP